RSSRTCTSSPSLHDALPIFIISMFTSTEFRLTFMNISSKIAGDDSQAAGHDLKIGQKHSPLFAVIRDKLRERILSGEFQPGARLDRKSTRLNSSHVKISYAV